MSIFQKLLSPCILLTQNSLFYYCRSKVPQRSGLSNGSGGQSSSVERKVLAGPCSFCPSEALWGDISFLCQAVRGRLGPWAPGSLPLSSPPAAQRLSGFAHSDTSDHALERFSAVRGSCEETRPPHKPGSFSHLKLYKSGSHV